MATIVVLNGTSSSGKTSIAHAFQELAPGVFLNFSIDSILYALPRRVLSHMQRETNPPEGLRYAELVRGYYACVRELAALGHDLVIDHAVTTRATADLLLEAVRPHRPVFVGLECPVEVLAERERSRGDRRPGLAEGQCARVHGWFEYDLLIDTSRVGVEEAARLILARLRGAPGGAG